ncbi:MAG: signal peptidase I [Trebonia sp.]
MTGESAGPWAPQPLPAPRRNSPGRVFYWVLFGLAVAGVIGGFGGLVATGPDYTVPSTSMVPTLQPGMRIFVARGTDVRRGDVVVFDIPPGTSGIASGLYVKRLIGLPGDRVACCDSAGDVTVNGKALDESQYLYPGDAPSQKRFSVTLGPGDIWVMGDHRSISLDSRYWGPDVPEKDIVGRVYMVEKGVSFTRLSTPSTFAADGLAPSGGRITWPLVCAAVSAASLVALLVIGVFGIIRSAIRGRRRRRMYRGATSARAAPPP